MSPPNFLLVLFPSQGHINPGLQFAKRLLRLGARIAILTTEHAYRRMRRSPLVPGITYLTFSDGYDDTGFLFSNDGQEQYMADFMERGSKTLKELILAEANRGEGRGFTCVFYTTVVPWAGRVTLSLGVPSVLFWAQPAAVLDVYYYYFSGRADEIESTGHGLSAEVRLPGLPPLTGLDVPSFFTPGEKRSFGLRIMESHVKNLKQDKNPIAVVNTFDELEPEPLKAIDGIRLVAIGPLLPSAFLEGGDPSDKTFGGDLFENSRDYVQWLNTKEDRSVIYVSFGSLSVLSKPQAEELATGLLGSGRSFLWVVRKEGKEGEGGSAGFMEEMELESEGRGLIVPWCSQLDVLSHPSVGCFVTHCGWNSTLESLACGVPLVAFPQWTDQQTNAKLVVDVWKIGVRVTKNENGIVEAENFRECLESVLGGGDRSEEIRRNANKWKELAREAAREGGPSDKNLKDLLQELDH